MPQPNLTSLDSVKAWAGVVLPADDQLLYRLIGQVSRSILSYLERPTLFQQTYTDYYDGSGSRRQILRRWPVLSVSSLTVNGSAISASSSYGQAGFSLEPWDGFPPGRQQALDLCGYDFCRGLNNVAVGYTAGYVVQREAQTVPSSTPYAVAVNAPYGSWGADVGVTYANGTALTAVSGNPSQGQYSVSKGIYSFAAADANQAVLISYSFVPADIEQACNDTVAEIYRYKDRIGEKTKSLGGQESVSFDTTRLTAFTKQQLQPYKRVTFA